MPQAVNIQGNLQMNTASVQQSARQIQQALGRITGQASEFQKSLDASTARVFAFGATTTVLQSVNQSFKKLVTTTIEVEKRLIEINSIFQATESQFNKFRKSIFEVAKNTGQAFDTVAEGAAELARQGLSAEETAKRLNAALILSRISGMDAEKSVKSLTAAINGFTSAGLNAEQIVNKIVAVDTAFAVSAEDLANGFARAGSTAEDAGVSFDELLGLITAVEQRTARGGAVIGNAFKSIFTRLSRGDTIATLKELGVEIDATQTGIQKLQALSNALEEISDPTVASKIKELAGGVFQINVVSSTLKDLSSETSIFAGAAKTAAEATNEAFQKNQALNKSMAAQINALIAGLTNLGEKIGQITLSPLLGSLTKIATALTETLDKALDPEKGNVFIKGLFNAIGSFISGPGLAIITTAFLKIVHLVAKFAKEGLQSIMALGKANQQNAQLQEGIVALLQRDSQLRKVLSSQTATQAQKEQAVIAAIQRENQLLQQQQQLVQNIVALASRKGFTGHTTSGGFTGRRKASGMTPSYMDVMAENAEASAHGYKAGKVKTMMAHKGDGTREKVVYNTAEDVFNQRGPNGKMGTFIVPPNGFAGSGFVPNFANPATASLSVVNSKIKGKAFQQRIRDGKTTKEDEAFLARQQQLTGAASKVPTISSSYMRKFAYLVPQLNASGRTKSRTVDGIKYEGGSPIRGIQKNQLEGISDGEENGLTKRIRRSIFTDTSKWMRKLKPLGKSISPAEVGRGFKNTKGARGALGAIVGSAFEVGIMESMQQGSQEATAKALGGFGDFDLRNPNSNLIKLFGLKESIGDLKNRYGSGNEESFYKKIFREKNPRKTRGRRRAAFGFVPNFANPLGDAIKREKNAGVPVSKIRAHFGEDGSPLAVTNTRDEKRGLMDVYKQKNAAKGLVPNFAQGGAAGDGGRMGMGLLALQSALFMSSGMITANSQQKAAEAQVTKDLIDEKIAEIKASDKTEKQKKKEIDAIKEKSKADMEAADKTIKKAADLEKAVNVLILTMSAAQIGSMFGGPLKGAGRFLGKGFTKGGAAASRGFGQSGRLLFGSGRAAAGGGIKGLGAGIKAAAPAFGKMMAASAGPLLGATIAVAAAAALTKSMVDSRNKILEGEQKAEAFKFTMSRREDLMNRAGGGRALMRQTMKGGLTRVIGGGGGAKNIADAIEKLKKLGGRSAEAAKQLEEYRDAIATQQNSMEEAQAAAKKLKDALEQAGNIMDLAATIDALNAQLKKAEEGISTSRGRSVAAASKAQDIMDLRSKVFMPQGVSESFGRAQAGEMKIAEANKAREALAQLQDAMDVGMTKDSKFAEGEAGQELKEKIAEASKEFKDKVKDSAITLSNTIRQNEEQLKSLRQTLADQQKARVESRFGLAGRLSGKQIQAGELRRDMQRLKSATDPEERARLMKSIAAKKASVDAISPAIFEGMAKDAGLDMNKLMEGVLKALFAQSGNFTADEVSAMVAAEKESEPQVEKTQAKINELEKTTEAARKRLEEFGEAFDSESTRNIMNQIKIMEEAITAVAEGTKSSGEVVKELQSVNDDALTIAAESAKQVASLKASMKNLTSKVADAETKMEEFIGSAGKEG